MRVVARVSDFLSTQLRIALNREHDIALARSWGELAEVLRTQPADVVILEPSPVGADELAMLLRLLADHHATPVVVYTSITPEAMRVTVELGRQGVHHVVFRGIDDAPARLRALLEDLAEDVPSSTLWPWVAARLRGSPAPLYRAVEALFRVPHRFSGVADLAEAAGLARRTVERWVMRAGFSSTKSLVVAARVERATHLLRHGRADVGAVAGQLGYPSARLLARQVRLVTGRTPSGLRHLTDDDAVTALLVQYLTALPLRAPGEEPQSDGDAA